MNLLKRIWPWSKIARLEKYLANESRKVKMTLAYLDQLYPECKHSIFDGKLYIWHVDHVQEFLYVDQPRMNFKVEGLS